MCLCVRVSVCVLEYFYKLLKKKKNKAPYFSLEEKEIKSLTFLQKSCPCNYAVDQCFQIVSIG